MPLLITGLMTMTVAQFFDLGTFVAMFRRLGPVAEANPLVAGLVGDYGIPVLAFAKLTLIVLIASITVILRGRAGILDQRLAAVVLGAAILAGVIGGGTNSLTMGPL
jgi:hypothetical protein